MNVPVSLDAAAGLPAADFTLPANSAFDAGDVFTPGTESYTSMSALPLDQTVSGTVGYTVENSAGTPTGGTFEGVSYHDVNAFSPSDQEIFVSGSSAGTGAPGDGSIFNTIDYGHGFENVYADILGAGGTSTVTDTLVTPLGDVNLPVFFDATSALPFAEFIGPGGSTAADFASLLNPADLGSIVNPLTSADY